MFLLNAAEELLHVLEEPISTQVCLRNILEMTFDGMERALYFQQDKQRIARCDYCWGWFIPKTKKATRYCDRVTDGFHCKQRGARFKRNLVEDRTGRSRSATSCGTGRTPAFCAGRTQRRMSVAV